MKEKHLKIFAGIFVVLILLFIITKPRHQSVNLDELVQNIIFGVAKEDVSAIEIYKNNSKGEPVKLDFIKQGDQWHITTYFQAKARNNQVETLLGNLIDMTGKVRTSTPEHHEKFGITDNSGIHIILKDATGKAMANLIVGRKPEDAGSSFVRFAGKDKVYFGDKNILSDLKVNGTVDTLTRFNAKGFVDLEAVKQKTDDLETIALVAGKKQLVLKKIEKEVEVTKPDSTIVKEMQKIWVLSQNDKEIELEKAELDKFFRDVTSIRASEVVDRIGNTLTDMNKPRQYGLGRPSHYIVFKQPGKKQENIIFGKEYEKDKGFYMQVQQEGIIYKVGKSNFEKIFKWVDDLPDKTKH